MSIEELEDLVRASADLFDARWPGVEFLPGWGEVFAGLLDRCRRDRAPLITKTKQKLGTMRVYFADQAHPIARAIRQEAMRRSATICEVCGRPGTTVLITPGDVGTRCRDHKSD